MSFTMVVKDEASKIETTRLEDISELSAIIRIAGNINNNINVTIENNAVARRVFKLFKKIYGISPSITVRNKKLGRGLTYILNINNFSNFDETTESIYQANFFHLVVLLLDIFCVMSSISKSADGIFDKSITEISNMLVA